MGIPVKGLDHMILDKVNRTMAFVSAPVADDVERGMAETGVERPPCFGKNLSARRGQ
jgi:hypothetical protein